MTKFIMCQPAVQRFEWEVATAVYDLQQNGVKASGIVVLFSEHDSSVIERLKAKFDVNIYVYADNRPDKSYIPSLKPYLMYRYLLENSDREKETYYYIDSDVVFNSIPDLSERPISPEQWYGSDCSGYMDLNYIYSCRNAQEVIQGLTDIVGIKLSDIENMDCIGAQYVLCEPKAHQFGKIYKDSAKMWRFVKDLDTDFQKWTVEMFSTLYNMAYFGITPVAHEVLDFIFPTDDIERFNDVHILHNAGVTAEHDHLFRKSDYINKSPFTADLSHVDRTKASYRYVEKLNKAGAHYEV